jgi:hypothetical protein
MANIAFELSLMAMMGARFREQRNSRNKVTMKTPCESYFKHPMKGVG